MRNNHHEFKEEGDPQDRALDALLGKARAPYLRAGFADRVLYAAQCEDAAQHTALNLPVEARRSTLSLWSTRIALIAALVAVCFGTFFLQRPTPTPELATETLAAQPYQIDTALLQALQSNALTADDLALVNTLSEVLDSDFSTQQTVWPY